MTLGILEENRPGKRNCINITPRAKSQPVNYAKCLMVMNLVTKWTEKCRFWTLILSSLVTLTILHVSSGNHWSGWHMNLCATLSVTKMTRFKMKSIIALMKVIPRGERQLICTSYEEQAAARQGGIPLDWLQVELLHIWASLAASSWKSCWLQLRVPDRMSKGPPSHSMSLEDTREPWLQGQSLVSLVLS